MANEPDPYRTLGLSPGASADDIRRAYRRLAKANHPDSAGEKALPRFLAIQAAYESLDRHRRDPRRPRGPSTAARATPARAVAAGPGAGPGDPAKADPRPAGDGPTGRRRRRPGEEPRRPGSGRNRPSNKATPGSTTYDTAEDEPFEPDWSGGTWYGASSGTYWTINPKEYADPRKHGPEYQRARPPAARRDRGAIGADEAASEQLRRAPAPDADAGWSTVGADAAAAATRRRRRRGTGAGDARPTADCRRRRRCDPLAAAGLGPDGALLGFRGGFPARIGLALVGWPPIGVAIATIARRGDRLRPVRRDLRRACSASGRGSRSSPCSLILLALPSLAALSAVGTLAALAASIPTAVILSASGGSREPAASASILGGSWRSPISPAFAFALARRRPEGPRTMTTMHRRHESHDLSAAAQEYLLTLRVMAGDGSHVKAAQVARRMGVTTQAASEMFRRLGADGLVNQSDGRELVLTAAGRAAADAIFRRHALLEWLLTAVVGLGWAESDEEAGRLQGAISPRVEARLDEMLGHPETCPHGNPIDARNGPPPAGRARPSARSRPASRRRSTGSPRRPRRTPACSRTSRRGP